LLIILPETPECPPRRGDYRVIHRIDAGQHRIDVLAVEHRSDAYRSGPA
jgi:mRNA-degrading endonuclease RelE of RelBE toxin-antitoxin system